MTDSPKNKRFPHSSGKIVYFEREEKNSTICPNKGKKISVFHGQNIHLLDGHISPIKNWTFFVESKQIIDMSTSISLCKISLSTSKSQRLPTASAAGNVKSLDLRGDFKLPNFTHTILSAMLNILIAAAVMKVIMNETAMCPGAIS